MALTLKRNPEPGTLIGVWEITETTDRLRELCNLTAEEERHYGTIRNDLRKRQWLGYRVLLDELMGKGREALSYTEHGKPVFPKGATAVSISHSGPFAAAIISNTHRVGIDIERLGKRIFRVCDRFLSAGELVLLTGDYRLEKAVILWGAKESLYKLHGRPEVEFITDIEVQPFEYLCNRAGQCSARMRTPGSEKDYRIGYERIGDYMLVYALSNE